MPNTYDEIKEKKMKENDERDKKYSRIAIYMGVAGFAIAAVDLYLTGEPRLETLTTPISKLTNSQLVNASIFSMSSLSYFTGGLMYGLIDFFEENSKKENKRKKNKLEKELVKD